MIKFELKQNELNLFGSLNNVAKIPAHTFRAEEENIVVYGNEVYLKDERVRPNERYGTMWHFEVVEINGNAKREKKQ